MTTQLSDILKFHPLPESLPAAEVSYLLRFFRNQPYDTKVAARCVWSLVGFGLTQLGTPEVMAVKEAPLPDLQQTLELMEKSSTSGHEKEFAFSVDWKGLVRELLAVLLNRFLQG